MTAKAQRIAHVNHLLDVDDVSDDVKYNVVDMVEGEFYQYEGKPGVFEANVLIGHRDQIYHISPRYGTRYMLLVPYYLTDECWTGNVSSDDRQLDFNVREFISNMEDAKLETACMYRDIRADGKFDKYAKMNHFDSISFCAHTYLSKRLSHDVIDAVMQFIKPDNDIRRMRKYFPIRVKFSRIARKWWRPEHFPPKAEIEEPSD